MKLLMFQARQFNYRTFLKTLPEAPDQAVDEQVADAAVIFVHAEAQDLERRDRVFAKALKNIKWIANKRELKHVVLHSFTHLSESKAPPEFAETLLEALAARLATGGYQVRVTPFGYTCEWNLDVYGESLAKVFKAI